MTHSLYRIETGELTGLQMRGAAEILAINTPLGCAWIDGAHDQRRAVVCLVTDDHGTQVPVINARTPERPADTGYQTWSWDEEQGDWVSTPGLLLLKHQASAPILLLLAQLDDKLRRPVGEIAEAQALGQTPPAAAVARLTAINGEKQALRQQLADIASS